MTSLMRFVCAPLVFSGVFLGWHLELASAQETIEQDEKGIQFYENEIKPILVNNCLECHGEDPEDLGGELALISRRMILEGGDSGPAVDLEHPEDSVLLDAVNYGTYKMPPNGKLSAEEIDKITRWVKQGMPWPESTADLELDADPGSSVPQVNEQTKQFWSFQPVVDQQPPTVKNSDWIGNDIDRFILSRLEKAGLQPAQPADRAALIRRVSYDLTGLPPTYEEVQAFVNAQSPKAYAKLVDRLLASPHYGEKWGRHWLDLVRYAESNSFERDGTKPFVWHYRDYVIRSFNENKPYDKFLMEQLAGDEIANPTSESIVATGYYRLGQWDDEPADPLLAVYDDLDDILATTSQVMLGLTINCARCHDHKIDPIPAADYYSMLSFFRNVRRYGVRSHDTVISASTRQVGRDASPEEKKRHDERVAKARQRMEAIEKIVKDDFQPVEHEDFQYDQNKIPLVRKRKDSGLITDEQFHQYERAFREWKNLRDNPPHLYRVLCVKENKKAPPETHVLVRGNPRVHGELVDPAFVSVLSPPEPEIVPPEHGESSGRRLALAKWITDGNHPLTARVMVNRIWQHHFGRGIVRTTNDFGFQGSPPTHPQLLDWLARQFVESDWDIKAMHRLMLLSNSYQMGRYFQPRRIRKGSIERSALAI